MRPILLEIDAFGPFADAASVDFSSLPTDRPFLIGGPTGAGKTSILDAMTYALYGKLPGQRSRHNDIRSDHASPEAECSVSLEFEAHGDRWRVTRRPAQQRASRRVRGKLADVAAAARLERL